MIKQKIENIKQNIHKEKVYKGPIIEVRGILRLIIACTPFVIAGIYFDNNDLLYVGFLCAAFTSASYVGIENGHRKFGYSIWVMLCVGLAVASAWQFSESAILAAIALIAWSIVSSMSYSAGPIVSLPVNIGLILYVLFLINNKLAGESFWGALIFAGSGVAWSYILGYINFLSPKKNQITLPELSDIRNLFRSSLKWQSPYTRNGLARGIIIVIIGLIAAITKDKDLIITAFTVLVAMLPGKNQTRLKILSRVVAAMGAIVAANILINTKPPVWIYIIGFGVAIAFARFVILRSYTYNSFFLITFPLFIVGLGGYYDNSWDKLWYTVLGAIISIIASELFVFKKSVQN